MKIPSDSDLNLSGGGSFRRFDKADHDYQLLRQGSTASLPQHQSNIPPQPLRPAPVLPQTVGQQSQAHLEEQSSVDSVFTDSPAPKSSLEFQMPPPRIPPPPPPSSTATSTSATASSFSTASSSRALPSFSMTNPFLPLLQASTQFFSQTLQGLQSFQNSDQVPTNSSELSGNYPDVHRPPLPQQIDAHNSYNHSSTSSGRSVGMSMGEYLFSAPPVVSPPSVVPAPITQPSSPPLPPSATTATTTSGVPSAAEFFHSPPMSYCESPTTVVQLDPSNPFSPLSSAAVTSFDYIASMESSEQLNPHVGQDETASSGGTFNWANQLDENYVTNTSPSLPPPLLVENNTVASNEPISIHKEFKYQEQSLPGKTIFDEIRDFNDYAMSQDQEGEAESPSKLFSPQESTEGETTVIEPLESIQVSTFKSVTTSVEDVKCGTNALTDSLTNIPDNPDNSVPSLNSVISTSVTGSHYSNFAPYRNVRSFSLRQASTDSIGSADGSDLGSPDNSLPSLQRAMSCDSVCSDTSVVLGELDPPHLTGHLCIGLEYDSETADLLVNVIEAKEINGLHPDPTTPFDSYVRVYLLPDKTTNMQTRVYRKSLNPVYKEKFMFGLELAELPIRSLVFYLYATDKFSNTLIGETELKLRDLDVHQLPMTTWLPLTDTGQRGGDLGEIMFSLSYLPTAERLTVVVVKARNLKFPRDNSVGDPFVKVYLLQRGKKVSKKKSSTKRGEKNPIFNEAMIFGVPAHALQTIQLRITVADVGEAESNRAYSIGHVLVGSASTGKPLSHWNQMLSSLRKPIAMWHSLRK